MRGKDPAVFTQLVIVWLIIWFFINKKANFVCSFIDLKIWIGNTGIPIRAFTARLGIADNFEFIDVDNKDPNG